MNLSSVFLITLLIGPVSMVPDHAIYISTFYIDISETDVRAEVRVFEDDLRAALRSHTGYVTDINATVFQDDVLSYFRKYLVMDISEHSLTWELQSLELVEDSYRIHLKDAMPSSADHLQCSITASYFFEIFPTQKNVLRLRKGEQQEHRIFEGEDDRYQVAW